MHSVRGHGRRVPEPHHPSRQHPQPPRRVAAAPPRSQLRATRGGAPPCRRLKDFGRHAMISESRTASPTQPAGVLDNIKDYCTLFKFFTCENEAFAHTPSQVAHPQLCILVYSSGFHLPHLFLIIFSFPLVSCIIYNTILFFFLNHFKLFYLINNLNN